MRGSARADGTTGPMATPKLPPIHQALDTSLESLRSAIAAGQDIEARDRWGQTPLFRAVAQFGGWRDAVLVLLDAGADPNARLPGGQTLLDTLFSGVSSALERMEALEIEKVLRARGYRDG